MNRFLIGSLLVLSGATALFAETPKLVIYTTDDTLSQWEYNTPMSIVSDQLLISPSAETPTYIPLASVMAIGITDRTEAVSTIRDVENEPVVAFTLDGIQKGEFESATIAVKNLPSGIYIFKSKSATIKVQIK